MDHVSSEGVPVAPTALGVWRVAHGLRQADLAAKAGLSQPTIQRLEAGGIDPHLSTARALAAALDVTVDDLFPFGDRS
jgi:DNA-binding XRE family transcriptional regulator